MPGQPCYRWNGCSLDLHVQVVTRCRDEGLGEVAGDVLKVKVNAPPVEGRANKRLLEVLAEAFGVARTRVRLVAGARSRRKRVRIERPERLPAGFRNARGNPRPG